jgi:hypothetical protein
MKNKDTTKLKKQKKAARRTVIIANTAKALALQQIGEQVLSENEVRYVAKTSWDMASTLYTELMDRGNTLMRDIEIEDLNEE